MHMWHLLGKSLLLLVVPLVSVLAIEVAAIAEAVLSCARHTCHSCLYAEYAIIYMYVTPHMTVSSDHHNGILG